MLPHPLINFEIQKCYQNDLRFKGVYSGDNLPKTIKDGTYERNLDEYAGAGTHWIAQYCRNIEMIYFDSFAVEHVPKEVILRINKESSIEVIDTSNQ